MSDIYLGDCLDMHEVIPDGSVDLVVTSPPYDSLRTYGGLSTWNFDAFKQVAIALAAVLKPGGVIVWIVNDSTKDGDESGTSFRQALYFKETGLKLFDTMIWEKDGIGNPHRDRYHSCFEYMFIFSKGLPATFNPLVDHPHKTVGKGGARTVRNPDGSTSPRPDYDPTLSAGKRWNVWHIATAKGKAGLGHPAVFPVNLAEDHIKTWSNPGDTVLDPFAGSGTTLLAAKNTGREYIGIEQNAEYFEIIKARLGLK